MFIPFVTVKKTGEAIVNRMHNNNSTNTREPLYTRRESTRQARALGRATVFI
jgi:hypothetical protein